MPGLACVHLMLPQSLGQKILEWDEKEAINCERDLQKVGELAKAEDAKNPEIKSVQYPGREQQASCVAMRFAPLVFMDVERPVAHVAFMGDSAPPPFYELPKIRPCLVWVKDKSGTLVAGKEVAEDEGDMGSFVMTFPKKDSDAVFTAYALYSDGQVYASAPTA